MKILRKIRNNLFSGKAVSALGPKLYAGYLANFLVNVPNILRAGDLRPLDRAMGRDAKQFNYRGSQFCFDCEYCDEHLREDSYAFGIVREIYIRDCYFKWQPSVVYNNARTVIDLGANRGAFSALMTTKANFILCVECGEQYAPIIRHNMLKNKFKSYLVETALVGAGGLVAESKSPRYSFSDLLQRHSIEFADLVKIDIEGSEFALFESTDWLGRVGAISMEVHPAYGDTTFILQRLAGHGFTYAIANEDLRRVTDTKQVAFIYAWKDS